MDNDTVYVVDSADLYHRIAVPSDLNDARLKKMFSLVYDKVVVACGVERLEIHAGELYALVYEGKAKGTPIAFTVTMDGQFKELSFFHEHPETMNESANFFRDLPEDDLSMTGNSYNSSSERGSPASF